MSDSSSQKAAIIATIKQLELTLKEVRKQADQAVECYQQEKNKLIMMRSNADDEVREIKLQAENTLNQLRQHIAKTTREHRRDVEVMRRQWLGIEEPTKPNHTNNEEETQFEQPPAVSAAPEITTDSAVSSELNKQHHDGNQTKNN